MSATTAVPAVVRTLERVFLLRHRSCFQRRYRRLALQFGLRHFVVAVSCLSVLFALGQFFWAGLIVCTLVVSLLLDWLAAWLFARSRLTRSLDIATIRRFWHHDDRSANSWFPVGPLHVCVFYLVLSQLWHHFMILFSAPYFWEHELPTGLSLGALDHMVNATFIAYLLVALFGMLLPAGRHRPIEIMAAVFVLLALGGMHVVIMFVSQF